MLKHISHIYIYKIIICQQQDMKKLQYITNTSLHAAVKAILQQTENPVELGRSVLYARSLFSSTQMTFVSHGWGGPWDIDAFEVNWAICTSTNNLHFPISSRSVLSLSVAFILSFLTSRCILNMQANVQAHSENAAFVITWRHKSLYKQYSRVLGFLYSVLSFILQKKKKKACDCKIHFFFFFWGMAEEVSWVLCKVFFFLCKVQLKTFSFSWMLEAAQPLWTAGSDVKP